MVEQESTDFAKTAQATAETPTSNEVCRHDGGEAVCNDQGGTVRHKALQGCLNQPL